MEARTGLKTIIQRMQRASFIFLFLAAATPAKAQTVLSETTWGGANSEATEGVAVAADGSSYLAGFTLSFSSSGKPIVSLVKFSATGSLDWQRTWAGPDPFQQDAARDVAVAADGSVYVAGITLGAGGDALLLKFSAAGSLLSQQRWGSPDGDFGEAVAVAPDGSVYLVGSTRLFDPGAADMFIVKLRPDGTLQWQKTWGTLDGFEEAEGVSVGPDGSVYVAGYTPRPNVISGSDVALLKLDPAGNLVWARTYASGEGVDSRAGVIAAPDGSVYVAGGSFDARTSDLNSLLVKFASNGSLVWDRLWGTARTGDNPADVALDPNGNVLLAGQTGQGAGGDDAFLVRVSPSGKMTDAVTWGNASLDGAGGVGAAPGGTISLGAIVEAPPPYSLLGAPGKTSQAKGVSAASTIPLVDATGTVTDAGGVAAIPSGSTTFAGGSDAALVRLSFSSARGPLAVGDLVDGPEVSDAARSNTAQPSLAAAGIRTTSNPASTSTQVAFAMAAELDGRPFSARVFDVSGRCVRILSGLVRDAFAEVTWDLRTTAGARVPNGLYFIAVNAGPHQQIGRIAVVR